MKWLEEPELRQGARALVVPMVDFDGVHDGDQGKNRRPHDHNRDYQEGVFPETRAIKERFPAWAGEDWSIALDLHCPWIRYGMSENIYIVNCQDPKRAARHHEFAKLIEGHDGSGLDYRASQTLDFGVEWNTLDPNPPTNHSNWSALGSKDIACTIEFPYALANGNAITVDKAWAFGAALGLSIRDWLAGKRGT